jgi:hypothetical protein
LPRWTIPCQHFPCRTLLEIFTVFSGQIALEKIKVLQAESFSLEKAGAQKRGGAKSDLRPWKILQKGVGNQSGSWH